VSGLLAGLLFVLVGPARAGAPAAARVDGVPVRVPA
jgi:hypothetical protein